MSILEKKGEATALEQQVATAITEIKASAEEGIKKSMNSLKITGAKEADSNGVKVIIIEVPYKQINGYHQIQGIVIPELEKKLGNAQVVIVAKRRAFPKTPQPGRRYKAIRNAGRTLRAVHEGLLDDVVYPTAIVAKRTHYGLDGKLTTYVTLDAHDKTRVEDRLNSFAAAYHKLTGLKTVFEIATH
ncbi:40S ribosomal protein S7 [Histomonas meleagridis]|uniref:40S ribosomal protein S7 n=1 Tax=Histomonas meleagridis TaxID=135588 RepID=UPI0035593DCE|nr:40S ribosomal protein S7 [Histomonas meleagridis]KAH0800172.1 40S ribosomal protein S7 [Histomonas meleagridis]